MQFLFESASYWTHLIEQFGYIGIMVLMALESSFFPFPSEIVIPPAGYLAFQGRMNLFFVIISGVIGSLLGAVFNYYLSRYLGRAVLLKVGKTVGLTEKFLDFLENFFYKYGDITTLVGRLLPGVRQYISLPAGLAKMSMYKFILYTAIGAGLWVAVLAYIGFFFGSNIEVVKSVVRQFYPYLFGLLVALMLIYFWMKKKIFTK